MRAHGVHADAKASRDLGPFPSLEGGFEDDLTLQARQGGPIVITKAKGPRNSNYWYVKPANAQEARDALMRRAGFQISLLG